MNGCRYNWEGRGGGAGDQWVKSGDWELGDHVTEIFLFRFLIEN